MGVLDITVTNVGELPPNTFVSVRYGEARRLSHLRKDEKLTFPGLDMSSLPKAYTVDVFRKVGTKQVSLAGISALGGHVTHEDLSVPSLEINGYPIKVSLAAILTSGPKASAKTPAVNKKQQAALRAKNYLEKHSIQEMLKEVFTLLLERLPADPIAFMSNYLAQKQDELDELSDAPLDFASTPGLGDLPLPGFAEDGRSPEELPPLESHHTLAADVLQRDPAVYERLKHLSTDLGVALGPCVKPGIDCPGHELVKVAGCYAGDEGSYDTFRDLFDPVLASLHGPQALRQRHPFDSDAAKLPNTQIDKAGSYAVSATIEVRRNLQGLRFAPCCTKEERRSVEHLVANALVGLEGDLRGEYYPLRGSTSFAERASETNGWQVTTGMAQSQEQQLRRLGMAFSEPDSRMQLAAGFGRHWPDSRGVFISETQSMYVWCNEEDHLRVFARQPGMVDLKVLWTRLSTAVAAVEAVTSLQGHGFCRNKRLGFVTACPSKVGAAMRVSVNMRVPCLSASEDVPALCKCFHLEATQDLSAGAADGSLWNITNSEVLGVSEVDIIGTVIAGCARLVEAEQRVQRGEAIFSIMPGLGETALDGFPTGQCPGRLPCLEDLRGIVARVLLDHPDVYKAIRKRTTPGGTGLAPCIKPAMDELNAQLASPSGLVAGDEHCYDTFVELFDKVLERLHGERAMKRRQPSDLHFGKIAKATLPPEYVVSVRAEVRRNISGINFGPSCSQMERKEVERLVVRSSVAICKAFEWTGDYMPLAGSMSYIPRPGGVSAADQAMLCDEGVLFVEPTAAGLLSAGLGRCWPHARGSFVIAKQGVHIRCNEDDHVRVVCNIEGSNIKAAVTQAHEWASALELHLRSTAERQYARTKRLGFLTVCPENVGTGSRCIARLRLPHLGTHEDFVRICASLELVAAWAGDGLWEVCTGSTLGMSEVDLANMLLVSCGRLVELEMAWAGGEAIDADVEKLLAAAGR